MSVEWEVGIKTLLNLAAICAIAAPLGACTVKTDLPFATARVGPPQATVVQSSPRAAGRAAPPASAGEQSESGGYDEDDGSCSQELGSDAGGKFRSAQTIPNEDWIRGCFVEGDRTDLFVLEVEKSALYRVKAISTGGSTLELALYNFDGELVGGNTKWFGTGKSAKKTVQLDPGTYGVRLRMVHGSESTGRYKVRVRADRTVAEN